ncbi:MAG: metallophosphoesterase [Moraxellaceae bacterium]|nr:metallophosphoesterase [Moraxellaceae bacterium]
MDKKELRIAFASDLHLRRFATWTWDNYLSFPQYADVIVLAGDIGEGHKTTIVVVEDLARKYPNSQLVVVAGNHEFYNCDEDYLLRTIRQTFADNERVHFLENDSVEIQGITFLGCTLWSDFSICGDVRIARAAAKQNVADFTYIHSHGKDFTPAHAARKFRASRRFLNQALANCQPENTVVVTHFSPGLETANPLFDKSPITAYFQSNVIDLIETHQPAVWIYGHNHYSAELQIGRTKVVSNQLGYGAEIGTIPAYDPSKVIVLEGI